MTPRPFSRFTAVAGGVALCAALALTADVGFLAEKPASSLANDPVLSSAKVLDPVTLQGGLAGGSKARVIVNLVEPVDLADFDGWTRHDALFEHQALVAELTADVLVDLDESVFELAHAYDNHASFSGLVTREGLAALVADERVESIETVFELELHTRDGLRVIDPGNIRDKFDGSGIGIAIVDSGADATHPALGGSTFPNEKVVGGFDFDDPGTPPNDENTDGHGTAVAGICAGLPFDVPGGSPFAGGAAPGASLYALRVTLFDSLITTSDRIIAALDWVLSNRDSNPEAPIQVVCLSLGAGRFEGTCDDTFPLLADFANAVDDAGITIVASTGNDGYCDAISVPACLSAATAVGAVYSRQGIPDLGALCIRSTSCIGAFCGECEDTGWCCNDLATSPDTVACYSNSGPAVQLLAPADQTEAPSPGEGLRNFGGTSAAAPFAAGAAAVLQSAAQELRGSLLPPGSVRSLLVIAGEDVTDVKNLISRPRVNMTDAVATIGFASPCHGKDAEAVLQINDATGAGTGGIVTVDFGNEIRFSIEKPSGGGDGGYVVHLNEGAPNGDTISPLPRGLGVSCFRVLFPQGADPAAVFNNLGKTDALGESSYFGSSIADPPLADEGQTVFFTLPTGDSTNLPVGSQWTLQGVIENPAVPGPPNRQASVTNAVVLEITN